MGWCLADRFAPMYYEDRIAECHRTDFARDTVQPFREKQDCHRPRQRTCQETISNEDARYVLLLEEFSSPGNTTLLHVLLDQVKQSLHNSPDKSSHEEEPTCERIPYYFFHQQGMSLKQRLHSINKTNQRSLLRLLQVQTAALLRYCWKLGFRLEIV